MNDREIDERVAKMRACSHDRFRFDDNNGNCRCGDCLAFVRKPPPQWVSIQLGDLMTEWSRAELRRLGEQ
ncbi:Uncharacterised protein [Mycobacteroides abscessus subsp. massiliense]|uniref:Uncharacterized protein n=1 Tax=Mycobacteroides abscessus subsp. massiliense TaxID=1962118 RepID=A0A1T8V3Q3_9MYCO|nr:hypothetical protein [Mycobacteroides abscessus]SHT90382.1 Uncharacterised protein [Mycobacteroides abscessus subsp. abscessus]SKM99753.1 Uncharacterised protein [Mycobacteroides abscessus subsp. massiliense]